MSAGDRPLGGTTCHRLVPRIPSDTHHVAATLSTTNGSKNPAARYHLEDLTNNGPLRKQKYTAARLDFFGLRQGKIAKDLDILASVHG